MILETVTVGPYQVNCYILAEAPGAGAVIIDPGGNEDMIRRALSKHRLKAQAVINTHGHFDHIGCDDAFDVPVYIHRLDEALLKDSKLNLSYFFSEPYTVGKATIKTVGDGDCIEIGAIRLEVIATPGHSAGGICLLLNKPGDNMLFSGDTLFFHGIGRTDFPGAKEDDLIMSIKEKLLGLREDTLVYPGHGPSSTIGKEKAGNPFLS
ncbi:MAG: MBL fold metallo-hydrolase [Candidatus Omnitrophota bacterium]